MEAVVEKGMSFEHLSRVTDILQTPDPDSAGPRAGRQINRLFEELDREFVGLTVSTSVKRLSEVMSTLTLAKGVLPTQALFEIRALFNADSRMRGPEGVIEVKAHFEELMQQQAAISEAHELALRSILDWIQFFRKTDLAEWRGNIRVLEDDPRTRERLSRLLQRSVI